MHIDYREVRAEAARLLREASVPALRFTLLYLALTLALDLLGAAASSYLGPVTAMEVLPTEKLPFSFVNMFVMLLSTVLSAGFVCYALGVARGKAMPYRSLSAALPFAGKVVLLWLLRGFLMGAGLSLFVIPGVWLGLTYLPAQLFLCDDPSVGVMGAMRRSREVMQGHRMDALRLLLSFVPLALAWIGAAFASDAVMVKMVPETLAGDLLYTLVTGAAVGAVQLFLVPRLLLSEAVFYRRLLSEPLTPLQ